MPVCLYICVYKLKRFLKDTSIPGHIVTVYGAYYDEAKENISLSSSNINQTLYRFICPPSSPVTLLNYESMCKAFKCSLGIRLFASRDFPPDRYNGFTQPVSTLRSLNRPDSLQIKRQFIC